MVLNLTFAGQEIAALGPAVFGSDILTGFVIAFGAIFLMTMHRVSPEAILMVTIGFIFVLSETSSNVGLAGADSWKFAAIVIAFALFGLGITRFFWQTDR